LNRNARNHHHGWFSHAGKEGISSTPRPPTPSLADSGCADARVSARLVHCLASISFGPSWASWSHLTLSPLFRFLTSLFDVLSIWLSSTPHLTYRVHTLFLPKERVKSSLLVTCLSFSCSFHYFTTLHHLITHPMTSNASSPTSCCALTCLSVSLIVLCATPQCPRRPVLHHPLLVRGRVCRIKTSSWTQE